MRIQLYSSYFSRYMSQPLEAGVYDEHDPALHGHAAYLVETDRAGWLDDEPTLELEEDDSPDYNAMTLKDLRELAAERGIVVPDNAKKLEVIALLEKAEMQADTESDG